MDSNIYTLRYLPLFYEDLEEILLYIAEKLQNPQVANDLLDSVESAILERVSIPESFEPFYSLKERKYPYYRIYVDNYIIYYVLIKNDEKNIVMEVRRILYKGQNRDSHI